MTLGAIPYWVAWSEGQVVFSHIDGFYRHGSRIVVKKNEPCGLLYVQVDDNLGGFVPGSHIVKALELAATVLGPNHFGSLEEEILYKRKQPLIKITHVGPWWGWRSGLVQVRGRLVLRWGCFQRKVVESLSVEESQVTP